MELKTEKLRIIPLSIEQFKLMLDGLNKIEADLNLDPSNEQLETETLNAFRWLYEQASVRPDRFLWYTNWLAVLETANVMVGHASFLGGPNEDGIAELAFGIHDMYVMSGFTGQLIEALSQWALEQPSVKAVITEADNGDALLEKALAECGFARAEEGESTSFWKKEK